MSTRQRRALLICNAKARNGALDLDEVRAILREGGIEPEEPSPEADCRDVIRDRAGAARYEGWNSTDTNLYEGTFYDNNSIG